MASQFVFVDCYLVWHCSNLILSQDNQLGEVKPPLNH